MSRYRKITVDEAKQREWAFARAFAATLNMTPEDASKELSYALPQKQRQRLMAECRLANVRTA